ncbi:MAG: imidazole glycerol phosphate synthase subunit HisF [Alphaproteobacteria bacterium]|nr:imidazole glycerol phosphate synthase subunit HisF [Alphaproteobacteria bacterium]
MNNLRLIARLDIKGPNLVKTVQLEGLRVVGDPQEHATRYYQLGADEFIYMDIVASLYGRNNLQDIVRRTAEKVFVPVTVGGGLRSVEDVRSILLAGADKAAINTAAIARPQLISETAEQFGSQCMVLSIEAKQIAPSKWECYTDNGRERTGRDVVEWAKHGESLGAGEILITSVDREGTRKGFDMDLIKSVTNAVGIPVIASGGLGSSEDLIKVARETEVSAVAMADILHFKRKTLPEIRQAAISAGLSVRRI